MNHCEPVVFLTPLCEMSLKVLSVTKCLIDHVPCNSNLAERWKGWIRRICELLTRDVPVVTSVILLPQFHCISKVAEHLSLRRAKAYCMSRKALFVRQLCPENKVAFFLQSTCRCLFSTISRKTTHSCFCKRLSSRFLDSKQGICSPDKVPGALKCVKSLVMLFHGSQKCYV